MAASPPKSKPTGCAVANTYTVIHWDDHEKSEVARVQSHSREQHEQCQCAKHLTRSRAWW